MNTRIKLNAERIASLFGCTVEQARAQLARNSAGLSKMADKAAVTGRKANGYSEAELRALAGNYLSASLPCAF